MEGSSASFETVRYVYRTLHEAGLKRIDLSASEIARRLGARNDMAVQSSLYLLERAGHIHRLANSRNFGAGVSSGTPPWETSTGTSAASATTAMDSTASKRARGSRTILMLDNVPANKLRVAPDDVERRAAQERRKLREMIEFCYTEHCFRAHILDYFGDRNHARQCGTCGNCTPRTAATTSTPGSKTVIHHQEPAAPRALTDDELLRVRKILACASRMKGRFGKTVLAATLRGSAAKNVMQAHLNELSTYGLLKDMRQEDILLYIEALCAARCLRTKPGVYPTISITELGERVMREQEPIELTLTNDSDQDDEVPILHRRPCKPTRYSVTGTRLRALRERSLVTSTIEGHLLECLAAGLIVDISKLVSDSDRAQIEKAISNRDWTKDSNPSASHCRKALPTT